MLPSRTPACVSGFARGTASQVCDRCLLGLLDHPGVGFPWLDGCSVLSGYLALQSRCLPLPAVLLVVRGVSWSFGAVFTWLLRLSVRWSGCSRCARLLHTARASRLAEALFVV